MISDACRARCIEELLRRRTKTEEEIKELAAKLALIRDQDFDRGSGHFFEEVEKVQSLINDAFALLRKINLRIETFSSRTFSSLCLQCGNDIGEEFLENNPMRNLCLSCQQKKNNRG